MSIATFIPKLWNARLLEHLDKSHVYANLVNRDYEGEIKGQGDTVHINQIGNISIKDYTKDTDIDPAEVLNTTDLTLVIDQAKYFNFGIDDIDKAQAKAELMDKAMARTAYALADHTDIFLSQTMATAEGTIDGGTVAVTSANAYETIIKIKIAMDKANIPKVGRWVVVPPDMEGMMLLDPRFASAYGTNAENRLVNGLVARAGGFDIYVSNNVPNTAGTYSIIASVNMATTFAEQIVETEAYRPEKQFKDAMKGLNVFGAKVVQPTAIVVAKATFGEIGA